MVLRRLKRYVPRSVARMMKWLLGLFRKPELSYLELHLTDHCNLNCKGCGHFSPLASPHYADFQQYEEDLRRLRQLFRNIRRIRLMGGEPLLHRDHASFIAVTRAVFPKSNVHFVTNGILLAKASGAFWDVCRNTDTTIDLTAYPPLKRLEYLRDLCESEHVTLSVTCVDTFHAHRNLRGDSDVTKAFDICRDKYFCPLLKEGRLYTCGLSAYVHYFNESFGYQIIPDSGINIHSHRVSGKSILRQLNRPLETCRWCSYDLVPFPWALSKRTPAEWDARTHRKMV
jgi:hypothetical protein